MSYNIHDEVAAEALHDSLDEQEYIDREIEAVERQEKVDFLLGDPIEYDPDIHPF